MAIKDGAAADLDRDRMSGVLARVRRNWRALSPEQRFAAIAAIALLLSMLLPWYQETGNAIVNGHLVRIEDGKNAFGVYSFVEAAIFVVVVGVIVLLWARAEGKAFHLPGGDGTIVMGAGLWVMFLIFYRQLDKPNGRKEGLIQTSIGVQWGIFIAFLLGALLAYAGYRIRAAHVPEPALEEEEPALEEEEPEPEGPAPDEQEPTDGAATVVARRRRPETDDPFEGQLSFDEPAEYRPPPRN